MITTDFMKKIDFVFTVGVERCNPNGDPSNDNRPRTRMVGMEEYGIISPECIKHKIRERLQDFYEDDKVFGNEVCIREQEKTLDDILTLPIKEMRLKGMSTKDIAEELNKKYIDNRAFGNVIALPGKGKGTKKTKKNLEEEGSENPKTESEKGESIGFRGAVQISEGQSLESITIDEITITKCLATQEAGKGEDGKEKGAGKMGCRFVVDKGVYVFWGTMYPRMAEKNGFSNADSEKVFKAIKTVFANDASAARPAGSMWIQDFKSFEHTTKDGDFSMHDLKQKISFDEKGNIDFREPVV